MSKIIDFTMGADPEFICVEGGNKVVRASEVVEDPDGGAIGSDGNGVSFEARPFPSENPLEVVTNIRDSFVMLVDENPKFNDYRWISGSEALNYPLGGHIHFGIEGDKLHPKDATMFLSQYLGSISLLIENKAQGQKRRKEYGGMVDYREQKYGFEYRTPSSWLTSPYVASSILCLAKTIMFEALNNKNFDPKSFLVEDDFKKMNTDKAYSKFPEIWKDITGMRMYQTFKPHIDVLYHLVENKLNWFPKGSMKEAWGIVDMTGSVPKTQVTLEAIWSRYNQRIANPIEV